MNTLNKVENRFLFKATSFTSLMVAILAFFSIEPWIIWQTSALSYGYNFSIIVLVIFYARYYNLYKGDFKIALIFILTIIVRVFAGGGVNFN